MEMNEMDKRTRAEIEKKTPQIATQVLRIYVK